MRLFMTIKTFWLCLLLIAMLPFAAFPQSTALVLSGGGAKGMSHIGVLKALEENNIPIDYIIGNSMGAMVGALYASGYSPDQINQFLSNGKLYEFNRGNTKSEYFFFQKYEDDPSWITIPFAIDNGLKARLSFNIYNIQDLDYMMMEFYAGAAAAANYNFDSLFVPFRCVATDIDSSELIILKDGDLAKAARASITFPFFVRPIRVNDKLLFDGGMIDNFPVDAAQEEFDPDFIIGSKAVSNYSSPNADDVVSQIQNMLMRKADFTVDTTNGVLIETITGNENVFQFSKVEQYIDSGYAAAIRVMPLLKKRLKRSVENDDLEKKRSAFNAKKPPVIIGDVTFSGVNKRQAHYFQKSIFVSDDTLNSHEFKKKYTRLMANENVRTVYPSLHYNEQTDRYDINFDIAVADPFELMFGGYISSSVVNEAYIKIGLQHLGKTSKHLDLSTYFGTFYNSFLAAAKFEQQGRVPYYVMLDFLISRRNYFRGSRYFYEDQAPAYIVIDENYLDLNIGTPIGLSHVARIGVANINLNSLYYQDNYFTRTDTADRSNFYFINPYIEFERDNLNRKQYASKGSRFYLGFNYYAGEEHTTPGSTASGEMEYRRNLNFFLLSAHYEQYFNFFKPFIFGISADIGYSNKPLLNNYVSSLLIASPYAPITMMQSLFLENYRAYSYGGVGAKAIFDIYKNLELRFEAYYYVPHQKILNEPFQLSKPLSYQYLVGTAQLVYHTPIGPIGIAVNYFDNPGDEWTVLFNIGYLIFNNSRFYK